MAYQNQQSPAGSIQAGSEAAIKTARTAKNIAKAAGKAATGDVVGAAAQLLKDENFRQFMAFLLILVMLLNVCIFFLAPAALFEALSEYMRNLSELWKQVYYSSDGSAAWIAAVRATGAVATEALKDLLKVAGEAIKNVWSAIKSAISGEEEDVKTDEFDNPQEDDVKLIESQSVYWDVYGRKLEACMEKITFRQEQVQKVVEGAGYGAIIAALRAKFQQEYGQPAEGEEVTIDQDTITHFYKNPDTLDEVYTTYVFYYKIDCHTSPITPYQALQILCLYSYQNGTSPDNIVLSGFLKWLGYRSRSNEQHTINFSVCGINSTIRAWDGGFLPQYLVDEQNAINEEIDRYNKQNGLKKGDEGFREHVDYAKDHGCSIADLLIAISAPNPYDIYGMASEPLQTSQEVVPAETETYYETVTTYDNDPEHKPIKYAAGTSKGAVLGTLLSKGAGWKYDKTSGWLYYSPSYYLYYDASDDYWYCLKLATTQQVPYEVEITPEYTITKYTVSVSYAMDIQIRCRSLDEIIDTAGLWEGFLPEIRDAMQGAAPAA